MSSISSIDPTQSTSGIGSASPLERMRQMREVQIANGFSAQNDRRLLLGLGEYDGPVEVEVHWYGAETRVYRDLVIDQYHTIRYRAPAQLAQR